MRRQTRSRIRFAVCIKNKGYKASLERGKVYRLIHDAEGARHGYTRILDESGEDYGYSAERFIATRAAPILLANLGAKARLMGRVLTSKEVGPGHPPMNDVAH